MPSMASSPATCSFRPSRPSMRTIVAPIRLGRLSRCSAKMPTCGQAGSLRSPRARGHVRGVDAIEVKNDFDVGVFFQAVESLGGELGANSISATTLPQKSSLSSRRGERTYPIGCNAIMPQRFPRHPMNSTANPTFVDRALLRSI